MGMTIDKAHDQLHAHGWSVGSYQILDRKHRRLWVVEAHRDGKLVQARATTAAEAWKRVAEMAAKMG